MQCDITVKRQELDLQTHRALHAAAVAHAIHKRVQQLSDGRPINLPVIPRTSCVRANLVSADQHRSSRRARRYAVLLLPCASASLSPTPSIGPQPIIPLPRSSTICLFAQG
eukprot:763170-Hanusia_phi.AAC.1